LLSRFAGVTNLTHLTAELFKQRSGIDIVHVPYKSSPEAIQAMLAGQVQMMFGEVAGLLPHVRDGRLRALGVASQTRNALASELPTMAEGGMPGFVALTFTGIVASAGTPPPVVATLNRAINEALASSEVRVALERLGAEVRPDTPEAFAEFLVRQQAKWDDVMQRSGIRLD
jgi:tripartite-type tricarboxylate transporter receptor subunit TctC